MPLPDAYAPARLCDEAPRLEALHDAWAALRDGARDATFGERTRGLAGDLVKLRDALFATNARALADDPLDEAPATAERTERNQWAIKLCTVLLGEMNAALGRSSERAGAAAQ